MLGIYCVCEFSGGWREFELLLLISMPPITFHLQRGNTLSVLPELYLMEAFRQRRCGRHADHKWISKSFSSNAFKDNSNFYEPHLGLPQVHIQCLAVCDSMPIIPLHVICLMVKVTATNKSDQKCLWCKTLKKLYGLKLWAEVLSAFSYMTTVKYKYFRYVE